MSEKLKSVSEARRTLPSLSKSAQDKMDRYIITQQGQPQSVLLGYRDYQALKHSVNLLRRGRDAARAYLDRARQLARLAGEKRTRPFLGLNGVLAGFFQPLAGNVFSLAASLRGDAK